MIAHVSMRLIWKFQVTIIIRGMQYFVWLHSLCYPPFFLPPSTHLPDQIHGNVEEDLERLRLEEAAVQRRQKLQSREAVVGVANGGGRLSVDGDKPSLSQLQRKKKELGELLN